MKTIKIYKVDPMTYTPFCSERFTVYLKELYSSKINLDYFSDQGISFTTNESEADVFISRYLNMLVHYMSKFPNKKFLVWTHEPRDNTYFSNKIKYFGKLNSVKNFLLGRRLPEIHIMNAYTGDIYINNYNRYGVSVDQNLDKLNRFEFSRIKHKKIVALMGYRNNKKLWSLKKDGQEIDLCYLRTQIALEGFKLRKVDIYGKDWPDEISLEDSRDGAGRNGRKLEILENYHFNLCFENTNIDYYCTEKIWESIKAYCLPIYYGKNNKIYEDFPRNSFLDFCDYSSKKDLFNHIESMDEEEFLNRMNLCIDTWNKVYEKRKNSIPPDQILINIVHKLKDIVKSH